MLSWCFLRREQAIGIFSYGSAGALTLPHLGRLKLFQFNICQNPISTEVRDL